MPIGVRAEPRVGRFLSSPQGVDVGAVGGEAGGDLGPFGDGAVTRATSSALSAAIARARSRASVAIWEQAGVA